MIGQTSFPCAKCYRNCGEEEDHLLFTGGGSSKVGQMAAVLTVVVRYSNSNDPISPVPL